uniref:Uncharacterized protein n=1 Tax=Glossina austeni TaxID=7395 RepID=A0A1A9UZJ5_GLOAU
MFLIIPKISFLKDLKLMLSLDLEIGFEKPATGWMLTLLLICCSTLLCPLGSYAYNIDIPSYVRHQREPNTMFGFSIAFHKGRNGYPESNSGGEREEQRQMDKARQKEMQIKRWETRERQGNWKKKLSDRKLVRKNGRERNANLLIKKLQDYGIASCPEKEHVWNK